MDPGMGRACAGAAVVGGRPEKGWGRGLACGAGLYVLSVVATVLVLVGMEAFNYVLRRLDRSKEGGTEHGNEVEDGSEDGAV